PREPYTVDLLISMQNCLDLAFPLHAGIFTCLTMAHVGELTTKSLLSFDPLSHIKPSDVCVECDHQGNTVTNFHLPKLKSAPNGEDIKWVRQVGPSDPHMAFKNHLEINSPP
ncbi:hypothetical protein PAXRUDRAFT_112213, partial [Paxillus rubicundulus Ve08.2h10]